MGSTTEDVTVRGIVWVIDVIIENAVEIKLTVFPDRTIEKINDL